MTFDVGRWLPDFPIREHCLYLDHAAVCPLPRPVAEAMRQRITEQEPTGHENYREWGNNHLSCRHLGSQLLGCEPDDISIVRSTSEGLSLIAEGLTWKRKDEVLVGSEEFAANVCPVARSRETWRQGRALPATGRPDRSKGDRRTHQ